MIKDENLQHDHCFGCRKVTFTMALLSIFGYNIPVLVVLFTNCD